MECFPLHEYVPCQERLLCQTSQGDSLDCHEQAAVNIPRHQMHVYFSSNTSERIDIKGIFDKEIYGGWFDPTNGEVMEIPVKVNTEEGIISIKNESADEKDRILILVSDPEQLFVKQGAYADSEKAGDLKKVFDW